MGLSYVVRFPGRGSAYLELPSGRRIGIPSGGAPDSDPPLPPTPGDPPSPPATPPRRLSWDEIDWDTSKLDERNLPKPLSDMVGRIMAKERKSLAAQLETTRGELGQAKESQTALESRLADLTEAIDAIRNPPPPGEDPDKIPPQLAKHPDLARVYTDLISERKKSVAELETLRKEHQAATKRLEELAATTDSERKQRADAEERLRTVRRDKEVLAALSQLNVIDPRRELALYASRAEYDANTDSFVYRNADGDLVALADGIRADLPDYVLRPDVRNGGSGSHGGQAGAPHRPETPQDRKARVTQEHDALKAKVARKERLSEQEQAQLMRLGRALKELGASA